MNEERALLEILIEKGVLGKGEAKFEVNVGFAGRPKYIDLVYEKENEIWLIESKEHLNYKAIGQILSYKELYLSNILLSKNVKLGIVCRETDLDIKRACKSQVIKVFVLKDMEKEEAEEEKAIPICAICGEPLSLKYIDFDTKEAEYTCETCKRLFNMDDFWYQHSAKIEKCLSCKTVFAVLPFVIGYMKSYIGITNVRLWLNICPDCRKGFMDSATVRDLIRGYIKSKQATPKEFEEEGIQREFIEFCLGRRK